VPVYQPEQPMTSPKQLFLVQQLGKVYVSKVVARSDLRAAASSSRATSGFIPRRRVNAVADVERLDHGQEAQANEHAQGDGRSDEGPRLDRLNMAGHSGILRHLCPSAWKHAEAIVGRTARGGRLLRQA
jgi:hypothetical protein